MYAQSGYRMSQKKVMKLNFKCGEFPSVKTLGMLWKAKDDAFTFKDFSAPCCKESEQIK